MAHLCNPRTWEIETGKLRSSMPTWATEQVLFQLGNPRPHLKKKKKHTSNVLFSPQTLSSSTCSCHRELSEGFREFWAIFMYLSFKTYKIFNYDPHRSTKTLRTSSKVDMKQGPRKGWGGGGRADLWNRDSRAELYWKSLRFLTLQRLLSLPWPTSLKGEKAA